MSQPLEEYLVKLGFTTDTAGYARFASHLKDAERLVDNEYYRMAKHVAVFAGATAAAFVAAGAGALAVVDKVAQADQSYRLFALRMFASVPVARELKIALDALGQPLENIMWDSELAGRFQQLVKDQQTLTEQLGPDFEANMMKIRDLRFEFTRFGVELKYLTMNVVNDFFKLFGKGGNDLEANLQHFNQWFMVNIPFFSNYIATKLKPVFDELKSVFTPENMAAFAKAVQKSAEALLNASEASLKFGKNIGLLLLAGKEANDGNYIAAMKDLHAMQSIGLPEAAVPSVTLESAGRGLATPANLQAAIIQTAKQIGLDPRLALAVAAVESAGGDVSHITQFDKSGGVLTSPKGAKGIFQLMPDTAKLMGVNPEDVGENILGGVKYLYDLLKVHGWDQAAALREYNSGWAFSRSPDVQRYAQRVLDVESGINIESLTINVNGSAQSWEDIADAVTKGIQQAAKQKQQTDNLKTQRNLNEFTAPGWSYGQ